LPSFWYHYRQLDKEVQNLADKNYKLLKDNPKHPSLHFKKVGKYWSARVDLKYRALAVEVKEGFLWFWIGDYNTYDQIIER
jgi:hypothetical protein